MKAVKKIKKSANKKTVYPWLPNLGPVEIAKAEALALQVEADTMILPEDQRSMSKICWLVATSKRLVEENKRFTKWAAENGA